VPTDSVAYPDAAQDLSKLKNLRANVLMMEKEQRKIHAVWGENSERRNYKINMEEQLEKSVICVVNARKTLADFQNYLKEVKYATWNKRTTIKDAIKIHIPKIPNQVSSNFKSKMCKQVTNLKSNKKPIPLMKISVKPPPTLLKSDMEEVKTHLQSNVDQVNTFLSKADRRNKKVFKDDLKTGKKRRNRRRINSFRKMKREKKIPFHKINSLQKLPHLICQYSTNLQLHPDLACPVGKIFKSSQELLAHVFSVHREDIFSQTTRMNFIMLACPYNDPLADVKCERNFCTYVQFNPNQNFDDQLGTTLLKLQRHINDWHLGSQMIDRCTFCGLELVVAEPRQYWQHIATHLQEYKELLPPGLIPGAPLNSSSHFHIPCNMGCVLRFSSSHDFICHLVQDHWKAILSSVSSFRGIHWPCPLTATCSFIINKPVFNDALIEVGQALTSLYDHLIQSHYSEKPAHSCPRCQLSLQHMPDHAAWRHMANHASMDLVWCSFCNFYVRRGDVNQHWSKWCKVGDRNREEWTKLDMKRRIEEIENIKDRELGLKKMSNVAEGAKKRWIENDLKSKEKESDEKEQPEMLFETMVADPSTKTSFQQNVVNEKLFPNVEIKSKYICNECGTQFSKELVLKLHMAVHK